MENEVEAGRILLSDIDEYVHFLGRKTELLLAQSNKQGADELERIVSQLDCERQSVKELLDRNISLINEVNLKRAAMCQTIMSSAKGGVCEMELAVVEQASSIVETRSCQLEAKISLSVQQLDNQVEAIKAAAKAAKDFQSKVQEAKTKHESQKVHLQQIKEKVENYALRRIEVEHLEASNEELAETLELMEAVVAFKKAQQETPNGERGAEAGGISESQPGDSFERHIEAGKQLARLELEQNRGSAMLGQVEQALQNILDQCSECSPPAITMDQTCEESAESLDKVNNLL